jgi:uncharacterized protein YbjT (DUF2867 family)
MRHCPAALDGQFRSGVWIWTLQGPTMTPSRHRKESVMWVLMGSHGNITSQAARRLLEQGRRVRVIGRRAQALAPLQALGAETAIGDAADADFLSQAFDGATAAYVMIPPGYAEPDMRAAQARIGRAIAAALARAGVRRVVNLSSLGADLPSGTGPIAGLHEQEQRLNALPGLDLLHLRPGYFMENHLHAAGAVAALGVYPSLERSDVPVPMVATADIAAVVARELATPSARGVLHLAAGAYSFRDAARLLGAAIGQPALAHVQAEPAQAEAGMRAAGFSPDAARLMAEMAAWMSAGSHAAAPSPVELMPTTLADFAPRFADAWRAARAAAA